MSKIPAINEIDANSPSQESTEVVVKATTVTPDINEIQETISASATIQEIDGTRKPTISEIYKIVNDGLFESTTNWWDYAYKISQAQLNQDIISRLDNGVIGGGYSKGVEIITTTSNKVPNNTNVYSALKSDSLYPKKLNDEVINGIYDFLNGLTIGKPTAYTGGTWSVDQTGRTHLTTDYLYVRLKAIFETLQILNVDTIGGKLVISPSGSIRIAYVDRIKIDAPVFTHNEETDIWSISQVEDAEGNLVNETLNQEVYRCYFLGEQDGKEIDNKWKVGDQAQAKTFNVKKGTYHKVENSYLWRLVVNVSSDTVDIDGKKYHYVDLSQIDFDSGSDAPAPGDILNQLGHRLNDTQRQTALVLNAVDNYAPSITLYAGINYYTLLNKEYVEFGVYNGKAFFNVYGDMYIGDKGENPKTYIKYKNGKINIKANLEIGSSIGDKDLDQYIKENGGVDEETVKNLINNAQVIKDLQNQADGAIETWFYEGVPTLDNLPAVDWTTNEIKKVHIGDLYYDQTTGYAYRFTKYNDDVNPYRWNRIKDNDIVAALEAANHAQATADGKMKVFYGENKPTNYHVGDMWVNATLEGKFNNDIARAVADNETFNANDWVLASRYSEAIATIQKWTNEYETKFSNLVDEVKQQKDQSIIVWYLEYEPTVDNAPANTWNTETLRSEHIGDIVYDIKNNHSYRWTGTAWVQIKDADFNEAMKAAKDADDKAGAAGDLADSKRRIFYSDTTPTKPFDKGDLWIKQVDDKTETWVYNGTNWVKSEDKDLADFSAAINEELAGIKGQLDGKAETWYQNTDPSESWTDKASHEGDIWYNTTNGTTNYWNGSAWEQMDIPKDVFDTIDGKSSIFVDSYDEAKAGTGVICKGYKERDLWILPEDATVNGVKYYKGDMLTAVSNNTNFDETNWKKKVRYVGQTELTSAIDIVNEKINTINNTTIPGINNKFNEFVKDGVLDSSEKARLTDLLNQASNEVAAVIDQVNNIITSKYLTNDNANKGKLEEANTVMNTAWTEYKNFINTLIDANTEITKVNIGEANTKYKNLQEKIKAVKQYLAICQADILSGMGTDISSYKYLKEAFKGKTEVNGGLVVTNVLQLRQTSDASSPITAGISGLQGKANADGVVDKNTYDITSIAAWFGGPMVDKDIFTDEQLNNKVAGTDYARSLFRHDGSGYLASGAIYWGTDGVLHGDPNSFILQGTSIATMFYYTKLFYLHYANQNTTDFNKIDYVTPMKTFSRLSVLPLGGIEDGHNLPTGLFIGDSNTGGSFQIGNIILRTKSGDPNILEIVSASSNKTAHLGVQGGISAYGTYTSSTGGGGGLNGTIVPYATAITSDPQNEGSKIASASSIYKLHSRISSIENNGATSITVTGIGNAITSVSKNGNSITFTKGSTFLTSHQSLADYYTKSQVDNIANGKSSSSHTHSVTINGVTKNIAATGGTAVDLGTYLTSHQSLANYVTINDSRLSDSRYPKFANSTWYLVGDDAYIGDHDRGGMFCIKSANNSNTSGIAIYNNAESDAANIWFDNTNINLDKQLVMKNKRIWIQGVDTAGGNNNRLTLVAGMPSGLAYNTSCRGTILYSNGIAFADPYNGNSNNDSGWIRHLETSDNSGTLEIAVGDEASNEEIHFRWYNTNTSAETIAHDITVPRSTGTLALTSQIPTNNNQLTNGAGYDTVTSVNSKLSNYLPLSGGTISGVLNVNKTGIQIDSAFAVGDTAHKNINIGIIDRYGTMLQIIGTGVKDKGAVIGFHNPGLYSGILGFVRSDNETGFIFDTDVDRNSWYVKARAFKGNLDGNASTASKWATARTLSLTGSVTGSVSFDGSGNITLNTTYGTENITNLDSRYLKRTGDTMSGTLSFYPTEASDAAPKIYSTVSGALTSLNFEVSDDINDRFVFKINYYGDTDATNRERFTINWNNVISKAPITAPSFNGNTTSATKLQTSRTIWGQSFDGTANVSGSLSGVGHIQFSADNTYNIGTTTSEAAHTYTRQVWARHLNASRVYTGDTNLYIGYNNTAQVKFYSGTKQSGDGSNERMTILTNGNIGIGTNSPSMKLHVNGDGIYLNSTATCGINMYSSHSESSISYKSNGGIRTVFGTYKNRTFLWNESIGEHVSILSSNGYFGIGTTTPAYKLHVAGDIYSSSTIRTAAQNQAIILSNNSSPAWISALDGQVIFNTGNAIRFGETDWDCNQWAGLKYTHSNKTIYLGIADGSAFNANSAQSDGTLRLAGIKTVTPDSGARIGGSGGNLYLGNANSSAWVKVQDMCSQTTSDNWVIYQSGSAKFKDLTIGDNLTVNGLIYNKGILPANYEFNNKGTNCYVSADALCSGITAITDSIPISNVNIQYSNDNGTNWTKYEMSNDNKFKLYANVTSLNKIYLGNNVVIGNNNAEKLAQIKKNQLMFTFEVPDNCYSQPYFASVDISNGVDTICTVEILNNSGTVVDTYTKHMTGWNQINYISLLHDSNAAYGVGNNDRRYIRFKFKHDQKTTALRNTIINKIRIFSFTKHSFPTDRFIGHTGHIYNFDYNMNTYFPNSILAKGGVTAYQSSDVRLKTNITKLNCLNVIKSIGGTYEFDYIRDHKHSIGFIAQNVNNPLLNDIVAKDDNGYLKINYWNPKLISLAFGALTEIDDEVDKLKARVRELESEVEYLKNKDYVLQ